MYTPGPHGVSSNCSYINLSAPTFTLVRSTDDQDTPGPHGVSSNCSYINLSAIDRRSRYTGSARCIPILARVVVVVVVVRNHRRRRRRRRCRRGRSRSADIRPSNRSCNPDCFIHVVPGAFLGLLGASWGHHGAFLGPTWRHLGANLAPSWGHVGPSWGHVGPSRNHLGPCWGCLGPKYSPRAKILIFQTVFNGFESHLEAIWCHLAAILSQLGVQKSAGPELGARLPSPKKEKWLAKVLETHIRSPPRGHQARAPRYFSEVHFAR